MADVTIFTKAPEIEHGEKLVQSGKLEEALLHFNQIQAQGGGIPVVASYLGMLHALHQKQIFQGLEACKKAARLETDEPLCYLNLARVYLLGMNDRYHAVKAVHRGLRSRSSNRAHLFRFYKTIGIRRDPPIKFLHRDNPLNKTLGKITYKK